MKRLLCILICLSLIIASYGCGNTQGSSGLSSATGGIFSSQDKTAARIDYLDGEYVLDSSLPERPINGKTTNAIDRIIFFLNGVCEYHLLTILDEYNKDRDWSIYVCSEYSFSTETHYICIGTPGLGDYDDVVVISEDINTITFEAGFKLTKVK